MENRFDIQPSGLYADCLQRYERERWTQALLSSFPLLVVVLLVLSWTSNYWTASVASVLWVSGVVLSLWMGRDYSQAVFPSLMAGALSLACAVVGNTFGPACHGDMCSTWCEPACRLGGIAGALVCGVLVARRKLSFRGYLLGAFLSCSMGAMGCSCMGGDGVWALFAGYALGAACWLVLPSRSVLRGG